MFDRFTRGARKALSLARQESNALKHGVVGTEHILLGLRKEEAGVAAAALRAAKVREEDIKNIVISATQPVENPPPIGKLPFSDMARKSLDAAFREASEMRHNFLGTEHILLGLLASKDTNASKILIQLGHDIEAIKQEIYEMSGEVVVQSELEEEEDVVSSGSLAEEKKGSAKAKSALEQFGRDLTELAKEGKLDPVIGRDREIERLILILARRTKNNPVLLGEPGVGKTAIAEGIAQRIIAADVPESILGHKLISLDLTAMVAGTKYRGQFEERIKAVMQEASNKKIILFIDELHTLVGAGSAEGGIDAANVLKPALSRGEIRCIGATTLNEFRKYVEKDGALNRRFQKIMIDPPSISDTIAIIKGIISKYEKHHRVKYTDDAIEAAVTLSDRYITSRFLPDKAIDVIDEAAARKVMEMYRPEKLREAEEQLKALKRDKLEAVAVQDFERAARLRDEINTVTESIETLKIKWKKDSTRKKNQLVTKALVATTVSKITGIPVDDITATESDRLLALEDELNKTVIGQSQPKEILAKCLRRTRAGLGNPNRPLGCFLFLGPTGVGKTLLVKAMAKIIFNSDEALITLDMSEYMEKHSVSRLIGAPPGYVGHEEGGQLTEAIRRKPYSIVLFDEIEKAHPDIFNTLLQIMEEGKLTDSMGRTVDFRHSIIVLTSNVGSDLIKNKTALGFGMPTQEDVDTRIEAQLDGVLARTFKPEFINRLDAKVFFKQLSKEELLEVLDLELNKIKGRLKVSNRSFDLTEPAKAFLLDKGWSPEYGARPLRRAVEHYIEDLLAEEILRGSFTEGATVTIDHTSGDDYLVMI